MKLKLEGEVVPVRPFIPWGAIVRQVVKRDLVELVAKRTGEPIGRTTRMLDALFKEMRELLVDPAQDVRIELRDLCIIETKHSGYNTKARNPRTGEFKAVPAHRITRFRVTKSIKDAQRLIGPKEMGPEREPIS